MRNFLVMVRATSRHHKGTGNWMYARLVLLLNHHVIIIIIIICDFTDCMR